LSRKFRAFLQATQTQIHPGAAEMMMMLLLSIEGMAYGPR
jgi:hypothetical protein